MSSTTAAPPVLAATNPEWKAKIGAALHQCTEFMDAYGATTDLPPEEAPDPIYIRLLWRLAIAAGRYDNVRRLSDNEREQVWSANEDARDPRIVEHTRYGTGIGQSDQLQRLEGKEEGVRLHLEDLLTIAEDLGVLEWDADKQRWTIVAPYKKEATEENDP